MIDNVLGKLDSQEFASVLTIRVRDCRVLGSSEIRTMPVNTVFAVNGNNVDLDGDLTERSVIIQLAHKDAPNRNIEDCHIQKTYGVSPEIFVENRRAQLLQDLINIICAWKNAGSPRRPKSLMAKYGLWEGIVGGIIDCVSPSSKFLRSNKAARAEANQEEQETITFLEALRQEFPNCETQPFTVADIRHAMRDSSSDLCDCLPNALKTTTKGIYFANGLGTWLKNAATRSYDGYSVRKGRDRHNKKNYLIVDTKPERHPTPETPNKAARDDKVASKEWPTMPTKLERQKDDAVKKLLGINQRIRSEKTQGEDPTNECWGKLKPTETQAVSKKSQEILDREQEYLDMLKARVVKEHKDAPKPLGPELRRY